jgi:hypothetical protein
MTIDWSKWTYDHDKVIAALGHLSPDAYIGALTTSLARLLAEDAADEDQLYLTVNLAQGASPARRNSSLRRRRSRRRAANEPTDRPQHGAGFL